MACRRWGISRYIVDEPNPSDGYRVPVNQGREAMAYLTYIIEHYDKLPDYIVFVHGKPNHETSASPH